jgi:hypothetical protein
VSALSTGPGTVKEKVPYLLIRQVRKSREMLLYVIVKKNENLGR